MADIHSRFILDDQASNPLAGYITVAKNAASATTAAQRQLKSYESALRSTELASAKATAAFEASAQQLDAMRAAGEAGTAAYKQLETQNERLRLKVEALGKKKPLHLKIRPMPLKKHPKAPKNFRTIRKRPRLPLML